MIQKSKRLSEKVSDSFFFSETFLKLRITLVRIDFVYLVRLDYICTDMKNMDFVLVFFSSFG